MYNRTLRSRPDTAGDLFMQQHTEMVHIPETLKSTLQKLKERGTPHITRALNTMILHIDAQSLYLSHSSACFHQHCVFLADTDVIVHTLALK